MTRVWDRDEFRTPYELGMFIREVRDAMFPKSSHAKSVCVGWDTPGNVVRVCDDNGAIDYTFRPDGTIGRVSRPGYNRRIEDVDRIVDGCVIANNFRLVNEPLRNAINFDPANA